MRNTFNIYCDESCHLEKDRQPVMVLGAIWCPLENTRAIAARIREIKADHGLKPSFEIKWTKVSPAKESLYLDVLDYFFDNEDLHFRSLIVPNKSGLRHEEFGQDRDTWYYKMYFDMLKVLFNPQDGYQIYLDIKDTRSAVKIARLHEVLCNNMYDFRRRIIERVQTVRSHEVEQIQLADLLVGIISYANRHLTTNAAKLTLVRRTQERSQYTLRQSTLLGEKKLNLFCWEPKETQA
jgi:hypothetical protein